MEHARFAIRGGTVRSESYNTLFGRGCVQCDANAKLTCPPCKDGTQCAYTTQSCNQCPQAICQAVDGSDSGDGSSSSDSGSKGPSAGPIAGGVIGGIAVIAIITFLVWKYLIKPKRGQYEQPSLYEAESSRGGGYVEKSDGHSHERRESVHTVHSIASTVLTRASNIIQIAYIPGVSNRATPTSQTPDVLVPPVPPIPAGRDDESEFSPYYARDSTYSGYSDRASSYNPRSSIASTIYGKQAQVQTASQAGMRIKPTVVSVKSGGSTPNTPPVPNIDFEKFSGPARPESTASNFSVGSTFVNTATQGRAQVVKVGGLKKIDIGPKSASPAPSSVTSPAKSSGKEASPIALSPIPTITETPPPEDSEQGPFADPPQKTPLGAIKEETRDGSSGSSSRASSAVSTPDRENGPFSDAHATK